MDRDKKIHFNKDTYELDTFADDFVNKSVDYNKESDVFIRADKELKYKNIMYLLKSIKAAGFYKVSLITE
jgi:biopolymer transport protein ExbD